MTFDNKTYSLTGATGKVGQAFLQRFFAATPETPTVVRALCHNRKLPEQEGLEVVTGSMAVREDVQRAIESHRLPASQFGEGD